MPIVNIPLPEVNQAVARPIIFNVINQVCELTNIPKTAKIYFPGDVQKMQQPNSDINSDGSRSPALASDRKVFIEVEENYNKDLLGTDAINRREHYPVFFDDKLKVAIVPIYATSDVVINFKYRTISKTEAERWRNDVCMHVTQLRDINLHSLNYHFSLPYSFLNLLNIIYNLREATAGYADSFEEYLLANASGRMTLVSDVAGKQRELAVSETQSRVVGLFDFDAIPEKSERDDSNGTWTITFTYKFTYEKPVGCNISYPIMVHNELLPKKYVSFVDSAYDLDRILTRHSFTMDNLGSFELQDALSSYMNLYGYIRLPYYDEFDIGRSVPGTATIFTALCQLATTDKKTLIDLHELDTLYIDDDIMQFIVESEYPYICDLYKSILQVNLYRNSSLVDLKKVSCSNKAIVSSIADLDLRNNHRVRFALVVDITLLDPDAIRRLLNYPKALVKIIIAINEAFRDNPYLKALAGRTSISELDFRDIFRFNLGANSYLGSKYANDRIVAEGPLKGISIGLLEYLRDNTVSRKTVMFNSIMAFRTPTVSKGKWQ